LGQISNFITSVINLDDETGNNDDSNNSSFIPSNFKICSRFFPSTTPNVRVSSNVNFVSPSSILSLPFEARLLSSTHTPSVPSTSSATSTTSHQHRMTFEEVQELYSSLTGGE
jgi:hypothetical protein